MARRHNRRRRRRGSLGPLMRVLSVLLTAVAIVAALTLFFKVDQVVVSGNDRYSEQEIIEVSGVEQGHKSKNLCQSYAVSAAALE